MITIQDVARDADVSVATVSRVLNDSNSVTAKTRDKVLASIKRLNYEPNLLGRNLRRMETKLILALLPNVSNPFYSRLVKGIEDIAHRFGYNVMLCNTDNDGHRESMYLDMLKNRLADGVIFMESELSDKDIIDLAQRFPVVQCSEYKENIPVDYVAIDNVSAAKRAVEHLVALGHRDIGLISSNGNYLSKFKRFEGYKKGLQEAGIEFDSSLVAYGDYGFKSGIRAANALLNNPKRRPTAIFAISDMMAIGAIRACNSAGLNVPKDIAVVGFDDISFASMYSPMLTTISQPKYDMGCEAMRLLIDKINGQTNGHSVVMLEHELKIRESTTK